MKHLLIPTLLLAALHLSAQSTYKKPPADVAAIVEARPTPLFSMSPRHDAMLLTDYNPNPGIATLAQPVLKLAGIRINPALTSKQRITEFTAARVQWIGEGRTVELQLPRTGRLSGTPQWAPDGRHVAFAIDVDKPTPHVELWVADTRTGKSRRLGNFALSDVLGAPMQWHDDSRALLVRLVPAGRGPAPDANPVPAGPVIDETAGRMAQVMTLQDLLKNANDELLFEYYAQSQLAVVDLANGAARMLGKPGLYMGATWSPDENYLLVTQLKRPFSYRVQFNNFARTTEIWDKTGKPVRTVAEYGVTDDIPRQGVVNGPRSFTWQPLHPARLLWAEALDQGDPLRNVPFRDRIMAIEAPFTATPAESFQTVHRFSGFDWLPTPDHALVTEYDRARRWSTTYRFDLNNPAVRDTLFDRSVNDDYNDPGSPVLDRLPNGDYVMVLEAGDWAYYSSKGASPRGELPRLDRINVRTGEKQTVFQTAEGEYEEFVAFTGEDRTGFITRHQSKTQPPNFYLRTTKSGTRQALTAFADPAPQLTSVQKRLVRYNRADGVPLSGTLYLPPTYREGQRVPLFIWAYPLEYSDASTAGQVRGSDNTFTFYRNDSPLFFVTQGYAVLMDATMPVVGDPETMNNTFIEQIVGAGRAAIDYLDSLGIIDRQRVGVGGHSYGAFMTANLLAHSDDYAFGIARSGAYNRTLTPFGFQSERRSFWDAKDIYLNMSPFMSANQINEPLLLIHGEADNNSGTHTIQSERLFQAIKGNGGTARLVLLPHESHGYRARESVEHVLAEMFEWAQRWGAKKEAKP